MASREAGDNQTRQSRDPLRRAAHGGPVGRKNASRRAAEVSADADTPLAPAGDVRRTPDVRAVPPAIPAGAAANASADSSGSAAGTQAGPHGASAAAAMIAGEIAFGQDDVKSGWEVLTADDVVFGTVAELGPERMLIARSDLKHQVYVPYSAIASLDGSRVRLAVASGLVDRQDWQQVT